jgi:hypothetical protein
LTEEEKKKIIEQLKAIEGVKRNLLELIKPNPQLLNESKGE